MKIVIDTNIFIDLLQGNENSKNILNTICDLKEKKKEEVHWVLHKKQLEELLYTTEKTIEQLEEGPDKDNALDFLSYLKNLENFLLRNPEKGTTYHTTYGDQNYPNKAGETAKKAIEIAEKLRESDRDWKFEKVDSILVTHAMLEKAHLFSRDKKHVKEMVETVHHIQSISKTLPEPWEAEVKKHRGYPILTNPDEKRRAIKNPSKRNPQKILEELGPKI
jgi:hypothetical protein